MLERRGGRCGPGLQATDPGQSARPASEQCCSRSGSREAGMSDSNENDKSEKIRYALGLFARVDDLEKAIQEIKAAELPLAQIKVIAPPVATGTSSPWGERMATLGADTWIVSEASGPCPWDFVPAPQERAHPAGTKRDVMPNFH